MQPEKLILADVIVVTWYYSPNIVM